MKEKQIEQNIREQMLALESQMKRLQSGVTQATPLRCVLMINTHGLILIQ